MSIHPSLNISEKDKKVRSVLKRAERLKMMLGKGTWKSGEKIFGLPKIKTARIKMIKKEKAVPATTTATPEAGGTMPSAEKGSSESRTTKESKK